MSKSSPLLNKVRERIRTLHYSYSTEQTYVQWIKRYILFHNKRHPAELDKKHLEAYLTYLAVVGKVAASTQNQALQAILFLYREVLGLELDWVTDVVREKSLSVCRWSFPAMRPQD